MGEEVDQDLDAVWRQPIHRNLWSWFRRVASALPQRDALVSFLSNYFDPACVLKQAACESILCCLAPWSNLLSCTCTVCSPYSVVCIVLYPPHSPVFSDPAYLQEQAVLVWFHSQTIFHCGFRKEGENILLCLLGYNLANGLSMLLERWSKPGATSLGLAGCRLCHGAARRLRVVAQLCKGGRV